jgi:hypothetical protein
MAPYIVAFSVTRHSSLFSHTKLKSLTFEHTKQHINTIHTKLKSLTFEHINTVEEVYQFSTLKWQSALQVKLHYTFNTTHRYTRNELVHQS